MANIAKVNQIKEQVIPVYPFEKSIPPGKIKEDAASEVLDLNPNDNTNNKVYGLFEIETANEAIKSALEMADPVFLYDKIIQEKELIICFADTGIGKTIYAMQAAINIAGKGYKVLFLDLELSKKQYQKRYTGDDGTVHIMPDTLYRVGLSRMRKVPDGISYTEFFFDSLKKLIVETGADVVFIDNMTKLAAGDTDSAKATIPILNGLNEIQEDHSITIIAIEHNKKVDPSRPIQLNDLQGSKMKANLVDSIFTIGRSNKDKNIRYVKQVKMRDGEEIYHTENVLVLELSRSQGYLGFSHVGYSSEWEHLKESTEKDKEERKTEAVELKKQGISNSEIARRFGVSEGAVRKWVKKEDGK